MRIDRTGMGNAAAVAAAAPPPGSIALMRWATYAAVGVAAMLIVVKFVAWLATDSVSMLSSLLDSLLDVAASLVNLLAVHHALTPADREHRFGHGKAEPLAGLAQAAFITGSGIFVAVEALDRLRYPRAVENGMVGIGVMVFAIVVTVALVLFQRSVVKRTGSVAVDADSLHYQSDVLVNGSVIVSIILSTELGWRWADPVFALGIAGYIAWGALRIGHHAFDYLMDRELPDAERARIRQIAMAHPEVRDLHDLRTRAAGPKKFIQMHLEMDGGMTLERAHAIADEVMANICAAFPDAEVLVHQDPEGVDEERVVFR